MGSNFSRDLLAGSRRSCDRRFGTEFSPNGCSAVVLIKMGRCMRLSRHARNEMRLYRIASEDVESTMTEPAAQEVDEGGNVRLAGETADGRPILVVVAGDDPDFVITVFIRS